MGHRVKKKIVIVVLLLLVASYEFWNYSTHADYRASMKTITCYGRTMNIKRVACCHGQCDSITPYGTKEKPPHECLITWKRNVDELNRAW